MYLQSRLDSGICLNDICLILLLFADDMVILSSTLEDLQLSLNNLLVNYLVNCSIPIYCEVELYIYCVFCSKFSLQVCYLVKFSFQMC